PVRSVKDARNGVANRDVASPDDATAYSAAPVRRQRHFETAMRALHQLARACLLRDLEQHIPDLQQPADVMRETYAFNEKVRTSRRPGKLRVNLLARALPSLAKENGDLATGLAAANIAVDTALYFNVRMR